MLPPKIPNTEQQRLKTLQNLNVLNTPPEERFDRLTHGIAKLLCMEIVLISLVDQDRQWFKSAYGLDASQTPRDISFCGHAILQEKMFIVPDARLDPRFCDNPLVTGEPFIRFYAGMPLIHPNGEKLGTLCVIHNKPRQLSEAEASLLEQVASIVTLELLGEQTARFHKGSGLLLFDDFCDLAALFSQLCEREQLPYGLNCVYVCGLMKLKAHSIEQYVAVIKALGELFKLVFRSSDLVCQFDEVSFIAFTSNKSKQELTELNERLVSALAQNNAIQGHQFTVKYCAHEGEVGRSVGEQIVLAMASLYQKEAHTQLTL